MGLGRGGEWAYRALEAAEAWTTSGGNTDQLAESHPFPRLLWFDRRKALRGPRVRLQ